MAEKQILKENGFTVRKIKKRKKTHGHRAKEDIFYTYREQKGLLSNSIKSLKSISYRHLITLNYLNRIANTLNLILNYYLDTF